MQGKEGSREGGQGQRKEGWMVRGGAGSTFMSCIMHATIMVWQHICSLTQWQQGQGETLEGKWVDYPALFAV